METLFSVRLQIFGSKLEHFSRVVPINVGMRLHTYYTFHLLPCSHCIRVLYKEGGHSLSLNTLNGGEWDSSLIKHV